MLASLINHILRRAEPSDPTLWHKWFTLFPVRLETGGWSDVRDLWRRKGIDGYEYKQDPESDKEYFDRIGF